MEVTRFPTADGQGFITVGETPEFEYANPVEKIGEGVIGASMLFNENLMIMYAQEHAESRRLFEKPELLEQFLYKKADEEWQAQKQELLSMTVPSALMQVISTSVKREQVRALRGLSLINTELWAFMCQVGEKLGFTYSMYRAEFYAQGVSDKNRLPRLFHKRKDGSVESIGKTDLTEGQLRQAIEQRRVVIAKFLDLDDVWHCFLYTYKGLAGEERAEGYPHIHYISSAWGIPRQDLVDQLKAGRHHLPSLPHIKFYTSRNPKPKEEET